MSAFLKLTQIEFPLIQGGMVWVSGAKLAAAVSEWGGLGVIGAGSMKPDLLEHHILKARKLTQKPFAVNLPILYASSDDQVQMLLKHQIPIVITSAGSPKKFTALLKEHGCIVGHVISHPDLAKKCEDAGVDFVIAEGFEAGGHNGRDELTTLVLVPLVLDAVRIPVIAAGGIATGKAMRAMMVLGAQGVQMGTRFITAHESSAHEAFKQRLIQTTASDTELCMKDLVPVRLLKNAFYEEIKSIEKARSISEAEYLDKLKTALSKGRAKLGMLDGDLVHGELEVGQVCAQIKKIETVKEIMDGIKKDFDFRTELKYSPF